MTTDHQVMEPHAAEVARIVKACMEGACSLSVPLVAHPRWGTKWGSIKPVEDVKRTMKTEVPAAAAAAANTIAASSKT